MSGTRVRTRTKKAEVSHLRSRIPYGPELSCGHLWGRLGNRIGVGAMPPRGEQGTAEYVGGVGQAGGDVWEDALTSPLKGTCLWCPAPSEGVTVGGASTEGHQTRRQPGLEPTFTEQHCIFYSPRRGANPTCEAGKRDQLPLKRRAAPPRPACSHHVIT